MGEFTVCYVCLSLLLTVECFYKEARNRQPLSGHTRYKRICKKCTNKRSTEAQKGKNQPVSVQQKTCSVCHTTKGAEAYSRHKRNKDGLQHKCKACNSVNHARHSSKIRAHQQAPGSTMCCNTCKITKASSDFPPGRTQCRTCGGSQRQYRRHNDTQLHLKVQSLLCLLVTYILSLTISNYCPFAQEKCRNRLTDAIRRQKGAKTAKTTALVGCTWEFLMDHIESQFDKWPGMSWDNMNQWHVDHIKACKHFDLTDEAQQRRCFHWSNLQPLWAKDNLAKGIRDDWVPLASSDTV